MALVIKDRVKETTTTTGTGNIALGGAVSNFVTFSSVLSDSDTTYYAIVDSNNSPNSLSALTSPPQLPR